MQALEATLSRRGTKKPSGVPIGLSEQFSSDKQKNMQWAAFVKRNQLKAVSLEQIVKDLFTASKFLFHEADSGSDA